VRKERLPVGPVLVTVSPDAGYCESCTGYCESCTGYCES